MKKKITITAEIDEDKFDEDFGKYHERLILGGLTDLVATELREERESGSVTTKYADADWQLTETG